jgi:hypothetical protein
VVWCVLKNKYQNKTCLQETGLRWSKYDTILKSTMDIIVKENYMIISWARESSLWWWIRYSHQLQKCLGKHLQPRFRFANHLLLIACFSCCRRSVPVGKSNHLRPIFLNSPLTTWDFTWPAPRVKDSRGQETFQLQLFWIKIQTKTRMQSNGSESAHASVPFAATQWPLEP